MSRVLKPGGTLQLSGTVTNDGFASLLGAVAEYQPGAYGLISATGVLTNASLIEVGGGEAGGSGVPIRGALIENQGVLINDKVLAVDGGQGIHAPDLRGGLGGMVSSTGTLENAGLIRLGGGYGSFGQGSVGGLGGTLASFGVMTNTATITVDGGHAGMLTGTFSYGAGFGATLETGGVLTNSGDIVINGGVGAALAGEAGGYGGYSYIGGSATNTGMISVSAGGAGSGGGSDGRGGMVELNGVLTNAGMIAVGGGTGNRGAHLEVGYGGTLLLAGGTVSGGGTLLSAGVISGNGLIDVATLSNFGTIAVGHGNLVIDSALGGRDFSSDSLAVAAGATLTLGGSLTDTTQIVTLAAGGQLDTVAATAGITIHSPGGGAMVINGGGDAVLNAADSHLTVTLATAANLTLSRMGFINAVGSTGNDTITALAAGQTLTGGLGQDTLTGAAADGDVFRDTAAGLNTDTIGGFAGSDQIDLTDLAPGSGLALSFTQHGGSGTLRVSEAGVTSNITLVGSFTTASFITVSDGHGGVLIGLH